MEVERARYLVSEEGRTTLASVPDAFRTLSTTQLAARLRRELAPSAAAAIGEQVDLQARARRKLGDDAREWLLSPDLLEMMTHPRIAERRARRLHAAGGPLLDMTCGLGGDLNAASATGSAAVGLDRDPVAAILARANVPGALVAIADAAQVPLRLENMSVVIDPSRRGGGRRTFDPEAFSPSWGVALELARAARLAVIKAPPGIDHAALPHEAEAEFVQLGRVLRECAVWLGEGVTPGRRRAVMLPDEHALDSEAPECPVEPAEPGVAILDPRSCVTRAGLVRHLGARTGSRLLDGSVAYLTSDQVAFDPLAETFELLDTVRFSIDRVRRRLREGGWTPREIRRRAFPIEPDEMRRLLGKFEGEPVTLLCTTILGRRTVFIARAVMPAD